MVLVYRYVFVCVFVYCLIITIGGGTIFVVFVAWYSPPPHIYILNENIYKFQKS